MTNPPYTRPSMSPLVITSEEAAMIHRLRQLRNGGSTYGALIVFSPFSVCPIPALEELHRLPKSGLTTPPKQV